MAEYKLKPGKIGNAVINTYKKTEEKFTEAFLEKDENSSSGYSLKTGKTAQKVTGIYKGIEEGVVNTYKKIEDGAVGSYKKIEDSFVNAFLDKTDPEEGR